MKQNVLFLCTGNSCRSQMAEGYLRHFAGHMFDVYSAGTEPNDEVHPFAIRAMFDVGIDISKQHPKGVKEFLGQLPVRYLIIVCSGANESCPRIDPGMAEHLYWPFDDPAKFEGTPEATIAEFRRVRDEIKQQIMEWLKAFSEHE